MPVRYLTLKDADEATYRTALETAERIANLLDAKVQDRTPQDFSQYSGDSSVRLEEKIHNWKNRVVNSNMLQRI